MKNFLSRAFFWATLLLFLKSGYAFGQPIQLGPKKENSAEPNLPLPTSDINGFWEGTPPPVIEAYFLKLPVHITCAVLRDLRARVLQEKYTPLLKNPVYEKALLELNMETGQLEQARELLSETSLPDQERILLDIHWLNGEQKKACEKVTNLIRTSSDAEWKKQNVYCLFLNKEKERAHIAAELLNETNPETSALLNTLFDPSIVLPFDESIAKSPFLLTVWCETGQEIPEASLKDLVPSSLALIARSEKVPLKTRMLAAEKALHYGTFQEEAFLTLLKEAPSEGLFKKLSKELASPKGQHLIPLFEQAAQDKKLGVVAKIFKSPLSRMDPSSETLPLASYMIRAFLEAEEKDLAQKWGAFFTRESPDEAIAVLPLLHLAFPQTKWGEAQLKAWQIYQMRNYPEKAPQNSYTLKRVLEALGEVPGPAMKGEPIAPSWRQEKALFDEKTLALLDSAAESKRKGEVLLLTLVLIGETPLSDLSPDKFTRLLKILHKAGYASEARVLALEFLQAKEIE